MGDNLVFGLSQKVAVILLVLMYASALTRGQDLNPSDCLSTGNYTTNSTYSTNLNAALTSLSSNMTDNGFRNASVGQGEDKANAIALCRADLPLDRCRRCVETAAKELVQLCPNQKQAIRWYEWCMLHYSNLPIAGNLDNGAGAGLINTAEVTNPVQFRADRTSLLTALRQQAANGSSLVKVGVGRWDSSDGDTVYALLQCVPTLSPSDCDGCLVRAGQSFRNQQGARQLAPSCNIRYEIYPFYNETRLQELNVSVLQMSNSPPGTGGNSNTTRSKKDDNTAKIVVSIVVPIVVCLALAVCAAIYLRKRKARRTQETGETTEEISAVESLQYDYQRISAATKDFNDANKLGQGGFGAVYRGKLVNGQEIAVKRLSKESGQGDKEFKNEALLLARLQHRNLVRLLGFTLEGTERLLIYEFVPNSSLDQFLFDPIKSSQLDWQIRHKIIGGIARGLLYLHEDSRLRIIHRDLKASNILLDAEMNPKIADFGMARLFGPDETQGNTSKIVGTYGYMSPEYASYGQFSVKSDVFSFGVLVLEIISSRKNITFNEDNVEDLINFAWKNWSEGTAENVIDPALRAGQASVRDMLRCMHIGLLCVQENAHDRPTMNSVALMLSSSTVTMPMPSQAAFVISSRIGPGTREHGEGWDSNQASKFKTDVSDAASRNEMSVTDIYPR